jgi:hypothetical protein
MAMSKKDFIALADAIKEHNICSANNDSYLRFDQSQLETIALFCKRQNQNFMQQRWFDYIDGECGPNGGSIKK